MARISLFLLHLVVMLFFAIPATQAGTVTLAWNPSSGPVAGYIMYYRQGDKANAPILPMSPKLITTTTYTTPDLAAGSYYFRVRAFDHFGNSSGDSNEVHILVAAPTVAAPTVNFSADRLSGTGSLEVRFTEQSTGNISSRLWRFGDDTTSTAQNPVKKYEKPGIYTVSLTATGPGGSKTITKTGYISVTAPVVITTPVPAMPIARFSTNTISAGVPLVVIFTDTSTGSVTNRLWEFGDGTTSTSPSYVKTYAKPGTYTAKLTTSNGSGSTSASKTFSAVAVAPVADFRANLRWGAAPLTIEFSNTSTGTIDHYFWSFGDGGTSRASTPSYIYKKPGNYTVHLTTIGPSGISTKTEKAYIHVGDAGLIAAYNFEETGDTVVVDGSGNGHHGTINGATRIKGKFGNALAFDGINDWVAIPSLEPLAQSSAITLEAWVYTKIRTGCQPILVKQGTIAQDGQDGPNCGYGFSIGKYSEMDYHRMAYQRMSTTIAEEMKSATAHLPSYSNMDFSVAGWQHVAFVYEDRTNNTSKTMIYVNGVARKSYHMVQPMPKGERPFDLGRYYERSDSIHYFSGLIDEVHIYNRALTASEIRGHVKDDIRGYYEYSQSDHD